MFSMLVFLRSLNQPTVARTINQLLMAILLAHPMSTSLSARFWTGAEVLAVEMLR